jgi:hypothetical protein
MHTIATNALAAGWIDTGRTLGTNVESLLLQIVVPLVAVIGVIVVWIKTHSAPAAIAAAILGSIVIWGTSNMTTLSSKTGQDVNSTGSASISGVVGPGLIHPAADGKTPVSGRR